jgi:hypothetical protein
MAEKWMLDWASQYEPIIDKELFIASSEEEIQKFVDIFFKKHNFPEKYDIVKTERITKASDKYYLGFHRDNYRFNTNKFKDGCRDKNILWTQNEKPPNITIIWYGSDQGIDFSGGNLNARRNF